MTLIEELQPALEVLRYAVQYPQAGVLRITGYFSSSSKEELDLDLRCITQEDYQELARQSLIQVKQHRYEIPKAQPQEVVMEAIEELTRSLSFASQQGGGDAGNRHEILQADEVPGIYYKDEGQKLVVKQLLILEKKVVKKAPVNPRARGSAPKTLAKNAIREQTPINNYLGRVDLAPGKFKKVEIA